MQKQLDHQERLLLNVWLKRVDILKKVCMHPKITEEQLKLNGCMDQHMLVRVLFSIQCTLDMVLMEHIGQVMQQENFK